MGQRTRLLICAAASAALLTTGAAADACLRLPGTERSALARLADGRICVVEAMSQGRCRVLGESGREDVSAELVTLARWEDGGAAAYVEPLYEPLYSAADEGSAPVSRLDKGDRVIVTGVAGGWCRVRAAAGDGWVRADSLALRREAVSWTTGERLAELAMDYLDRPYVYAAADPALGFDCSGFVYYAAGCLGIPLWRTAADICRNNGAEVAYQDLATGDLVFFHSNTDWVGHVGIYLTDGEFIHASSGGGRVMVSSLSDAYYARNYVCARRLG